ncbi:tryptophan 7-halogenase [Streptomyces xiaopingdaonensis]|uniref:tryptophan 7-halogenase n=1 Tax=Streptomyces xiaopingdaonensis TaxID=1565415 RepID=UPI0002EC29DC|nr:tryptophan 7-halogenase [Streptomyces xiaopingdaonensis]
MPRALVIGGSVAGLVAALALADAGHEVGVVERDGDPVPENTGQAHESWRRPTVPQVHQSHAFGSLGTNILRTRMPAVYRRLVEAGAREIRLGEAMPPTLTDRTPQPGDEELRMLGSRRTTFELVLRQVVAEDSRIGLTPGATVDGLVVTESGRVAGARLRDGTRLPADLVIDASGRRSHGAEWLAAEGIAQPRRTTHSADITYYTRYYQAHSPKPAGPLNRGFGAGGLWDHYTAVLFLGDNDTFTLSFGVLPEDTEAKALRRTEVFDAAVRATPLLAPWVDPEYATPISAVHSMGGLDNSLRVHDEQTPPVPGYLPIGDAVCTTNPAYGRGVSLAIAHATALVDLLGDHPEPDEEQARAAAELARETFTPWFEDAVRNDAGRAGLWRATLAGNPPQKPPEGVLTFADLAEASGTDPVVWRRMVRSMMSLDDPAAMYGDEEIRLRVKQAAASPVPGFPAPDRASFVETLRAA